MKRVSVMVPDSEVVRVVKTLRDGGLTVQAQEVADGPLPEPWGVLYAGPNPDDSRKNCKACMMWVEPENKCAIHDPNGQEITGDYVCGYFVYGTPMKEWMDHPGIDYVDPELSGLDDIPGGTSCDICAFFVEGSNVCRAVQQEGLAAGVEPRGCCGRWETGNAPAEEPVVEEV